MPPKPHAHSEPLIDAVMDVCRAIVHRSSDNPRPDLSSDDWRAVAALLCDHGLSGALFVAARTAEWRLPEDVVSLLRQDYLHQAGRNALALCQLEEIGAAMASADVGVVALKGASGLLTTQRTLGLRRLSDLDLLVTESSTASAVAAMERLGYLQSYLPHTSEFDALVSARLGHLPDFRRPDRLVVEVHTALLGGRGYERRATEDAWIACRPIGPAGSTLRVLTPEHAFIHGCVHCARHITMGFRVLKWLVDVAIAAGSVEWNATWATARRWGVADDVDLIAESLHERLSVAVPNAPGRFRAISARSAMDGPASRRSGEVTQVPAKYVRRLAAFREIPSLTGRITYVVRLVFPSSRYLRERYEVTDTAMVALLHVVHPIRLVGRLVVGLVHSAIPGEFARRRNR